MIINPQNWTKLIADTPLPKWTINDRIYYHKLEALMATADIGDVKYDCFHDTLDSINWSIEPENSYQELCCQRAQQIRDQHPWVRLWYSGGADSHTALMSFYRAGIWPDEVITMRWSGMLQPNNPVNVETDHVVGANLAYLQSIFPRTRFRRIEYHNDWFQKNMTTDWYLYMFKHEFNYPFARNVSVSHDIDPSLLDAYQKYSTVANVTGEPKPNILQRHGRWWAVIIDNQISGMHGIPGLEMFHLSPNLPGLFIKQCHMLKQDFVKRNTGFDEKSIWRLNHDLVAKNRALQRHNEFDSQNISLLQWRHGKILDHNGDGGFNVLAEKFLPRDQASYYGHYKKEMHSELWTRKSDFFPTGYLVRNGVAIFSHFWCLDQHDTKVVDDLFPAGFDL